MKPRVAESETSPNVGDLRAFCMTVDLGSVTEAARALGETKGSVSRRVTRLERALGVELLRRSPRLVHATEDGAAYRARVGRAIELLDEANAEAQHARAVPSGHLRVTAPFDLAVSLFAPLVADFLEKYPQITVEMLLTEAMLDFDAHQVDVALRAAGALRDSSLVAHKLEDVRGGLYASPAYLAAHRAPARVRDLERHRLLVFRASRGHATLTLRKRSGSKPIRLRVRAALGASDFAFTREAALAAGGIALLPSLVVDRDVVAGRLVPVLEDWVLMSAAVYLVHPAARFLSAKVRVFRDFMIGAFSSGKRGRIT